MTNDKRLSWLLHTTIVGGSILAVAAVAATAVATEAAIIWSFFTSIFYLFSFFSSTGDVNTSRFHIRLIILKVVFSFFLLPILLPNGSRYRFQADALPFRNGSFYPLLAAAMRSILPLVNRPVDRMKPSTRGPVKALLTINFLRTDLRFSVHNCSSK